MDPRIAQVVQMMKDNLPRHLCLARIARGHKLSLSRMGHLFSAETGTTPTRYLSELRLAVARDMLITSTLSVKVIMFQVGIKDKNHFRREFRRLYQTSPTSYRTSHQLTGKR